MSNLPASSRTPFPCPRITHLSFAVLLAGLLLAFSGCGYTVERHAGPLDDSAPRIAIATLDNDSSEPGVERLVSEALRREWLRRGRYRLVDDVRDADWVLRGRVLPVQRITETLSSVVLALEQTVSLSIELEVVRADEAAAPLQTAQLSESEMFLASADLEADRKNRTEALRRVSGLLAERAHDAVEAEWPE